MHMFPLHSPRLENQPLRSENNKVLLVHCLRRKKGMYFVNADEMTHRIMQHGLFRGGSVGRIGWVG